MTEKLKQALIKETERHIAQDILYEDVYVGPFTEKDGIDCAIHAVEWYRNNVWHDVNEPPICGDSIVTTIIVKFKNSESISPYYLIKGSLWNDIVVSYEIEKWAYMEDLLPDMKGGES